MNKSPDILRKIDTESPDLFTQLDRQFADLMQRLSGENCPELVLAARLVSSRTGKGSVCVHIPSAAGLNIYEFFTEDINTQSIRLYDKDHWLTRLRNNKVVGKPGEIKPLILDDSGRLYLYRYRLYEQKLSENIKARLSTPYEINTELLKQSADRLFKSNDEIEQKTAAIAACLSSFCVITGGPGTGKTSLVIKILAMLLENSKAEKLRIALAAPTGKAAARLSESLKNTRELIDCDNKIRMSFPEESFTIHRLLGSKPGTSNFRHNSGVPLPFDIVIIDEFSMTDLALASKLFDAVPVKSRLILLGDKDQLSSVEAGAVLGDICDTGEKHGFSQSFKDRLEKILFAKNYEQISNSQSKHTIADSIITLRKSYRFAGGSGIGELSKAIKEGEAEKALEILKCGKFEDISLTEFKANQLLTVSPNSKDSLPAKIIAGYSPYINENSTEEALSLFSSFSILCAVRKGMFGVERINQYVEEILTTKGLLSAKIRWYEKRPVMITRNDYSTRLFNGDSGLILPDPKDGTMRFYSQDNDGSIRKILPLKLPEHETSFAVTVHKSQGSEFDNVILLLPDRMSPVLSRELLYTAVTRARKKIEIYAVGEILRQMINNPAERISGLRDSLWNS